MALAAGDRLGPYQIVAPIGAGGMGQVYRAHDPRTGRDVAIKTTAGCFSERLDREIRAIAALNHPHICQLYDVGPNYLVMELIEGETLSGRLKKGALPLEQVLRYGAQIAIAIAAAHEKTLIHRDLKPSNVMITKLGVKVLDFGLAKSAQDETATLTGAVMGTPAYMPPEQREGRDCDARTDIFALGLILFEMATGRRPPAGQIPPMEDLPEKLGHIIEVCLEPDPAHRWQSAGDVRTELEWAARKPSSFAPVRGRSKPWVWAAGAGILALAVSTLAVNRYRNRVAPVGDLPTQFVLSVQNSLDAESNTGIETMPAPSPDGRFLVLLGRSQAGKRQLWLRPLDSAEARPLPGTEGAEAGAFWSPDGRWIGFVVEGKLKKVSPSGGLPVTVAAGVRTGAWGARGDFLVSPGNRTPLYRISEAGGPPVQVTQLDISRTENSHRYPQFLPDGRRFLFTARCGQRQFNALYLGSLDSGRVKRLMPIDSNAQYVPPQGGRPGVIVYYREGALVARRFDLEREEVTGEPAPVFDGVAYQPASTAALFRLSNDGRIALLERAGAVDTELIWHERDGRQSGKVGSRGNYFQPRISPDGTRLAYTGADPQTGNRDIFVMEMARGIPIRLTTNPANDWFPVWSPDGKQLIFGSDRDGGTDLTTFLKRSIDNGASETRFAGANPYDWSRDGRWLGLSEQPDRRIWIAPAAAGAKPFLFADSMFRSSGPRFSPDGKWLAYTSNESGRFEVYVRPFAGGPAAAEGQLQISNAGGDFPVWKPAGGELYYLGADQTLYAVNTAALVKSGSVANPVRLFRACEGKQPVGMPSTDQIYGYAYDTHDGQRFLFNCAAEPPGQFTVLLNWPFAGKI